MARMAVKRKSKRRSTKRPVKRTRKRGGRTKSRTRRKKPATSPYARVIGDLGVFFITLFAGFLAVFAYFARDLPDTGVLWRDDAAPTITLIAADGSPIPVHGVSAGAPVRLADLPGHVPNAILAVEDRNFYHHFGVNPVSIGRAVMVNARSGGVRQGGSTITQQLAKNVFLSHDRTYKRKIQEVMLAFWLEWNFTKDEILTLYLNRVYFGAGAYGVDAASYRYFGKSAHNLNIGEAAVLAGLLKAPSRFAPTENPVDAGKRGRLVIDQMVDAEFLSPEQAGEAIKDPILLSPPRFATAPYFIDYLLREAKRLAGDVDSDLIVRTTFDPRYQDAAETGVAAGFALAGAGVAETEVAAVIIDGEGAVKAMVGGRDYRTSQFNRAVQAQRQPGSAFKPFVYLAAIKAGYSPDDRILDAPVTVGSWSPDNYNSKFYGEVSLREAMALSLNSAAVRTQEFIGRDEVRNVARAMGWEGDLNSGPALGLGVDAISPLGLAQSYAPFVNGGYRVKTFVIERIETPDGEIVYQRSGMVSGEAADRDSIDSVNNMMRGVVDWGTGKAAAMPGYRVAGKTGTSQDGRDAWFAGHVGGHVGIVWVGRDDNQPVTALTGGKAPAIIWREIMERSAPERRYDDDGVAALIHGIP